MSPPAPDARRDLAAAGHRGLASVFLDHLAADAKRAGCGLDALDLHVSAGALVFGDDVERLIPERKPGLAFSLGAMGSRRHNFYNDAYRRAGINTLRVEPVGDTLDARPAALGRLIELGRSL